MKVTLPRGSAIRGALARSPRHVHLVTWLSVRGDMMSACDPMGHTASRLYRQAFAHSWCAALAQYPVAGGYDKLTNQALRKLRKLHDALFGERWAVRVLQSAARGRTPPTLRKPKSEYDRLWDQMHAEVATRRQLSVAAAWSAHFVIDWAGELS